MSTAAQATVIAAPAYACSAYGLRFRSVVPLPGARATDSGRVDAEVRWADLERLAKDLLARNLAASVTEGEAGLTIPGIGTFLVRNGREILVSADAAPGQALHLALLGPVLAALLQQRGNLVLHASAVQVRGAAAGFLGGSGAGKSTMAAAFFARGYPVLTDDILAISLQDGSPRVTPGFPQLKLWPDAVAALGGDPELLRRVREGHDKRVQPVGRNASSAGLPLACLYVLSDGDSVAIEPMPLRDAFLEVVSHCYGIAWLHGVSGPAQFRARADLIRQVPVRRLRRPPGLELVPQMLRLVEEDLATR